jgi:arylsulfatase A
MLHEGLYWEYPARNGIGRASRIEQWKAVQNGPNAAVELYNLDNDPSESTDIAANCPEIVNQLVEFMDGQHVDVRDYPSLELEFGIDDFVR